MVTKFYARKARFEAVVFRRKTLEGRYILARDAGTAFHTSHEEGFMHWLWVILIGLVVGALAKLITPGRDPGGFIVTILIGIAGSIVATWLGRAIGWYQEGQSAGFIMSLLGAILLLAIYHLIRKRPA
jgi:uncharacterized membrane protein YeaQ/YmgE (transglycosylase-associated protein family)